MPSNNCRRNHFTESSYSDLFYDINFKKYLSLAAQIGPPINGCRPRSTKPETLSSSKQSQITQPRTFGTIFHNCGRFSSEPPMSTLILVKIFSCLMSSDITQRWQVYPKDGTYLSAFITVKL